jgi:hypothetical protein
VVPTVPPACAAPASTSAARDESREARRVMACLLSMKSART